MRSSARQLAEATDAGEVTKSSESQLAIARLAAVCQSSCAGKSCEGRHVASGFETAEWRIGSTASRSRPEWAMNTVGRLPFTAASCRLNDTACPDSAPWDALPVRPSSRFAAALACRPMCVIG